MGIDLIRCPDESSRGVILAFGIKENFLHMTKSAEKAIRGKIIRLQIISSNGSVSVQLQSGTLSGRLPGKALLSGLKLMVIYKLFFPILKNPLFIKKRDSLMLFIQNFHFLITILQYPILKFCIRSMYRQTINISVCRYSIANKRLLLRTCRCSIIKTGSGIFSL